MFADRDMFAAIFRPNRQARPWCGYWTVSVHACHPVVSTRQLSAIRSTALHILFVCTGNICRSPTAERLALAMATETRIPGFEASSAGTRAVVGHPVHPDAERVLIALGGDSTNFAARHLSGKIATGADLILTMTRTHRNTVLEIAPQRLRRTFTLLEAARLVTEQNARTIAELANLRPHLDDNSNVDIADPIGQSPEVFAAIGDQIAAALPPVLELCRS